MNLDTKLNHFYDCVIQDATLQSDTIIKEYKEKLEKIYEDKKADALQKSRQTLTFEKETLLREKNKTLSLEKNHIRKQITELNDMLKMKLFQDVETRLKEYMKTPDYTELLKKQLSFAKNFAKEEPMTIYINSSDIDKKESLEKASGLTLTESETDFYGGIRAVISSKNILIDLSFLVKLAEEKEKFTF